MVVRCDAGRDVGGGHLLRCLALAGEVRARGGEATFVSSIDSEVLRARVREKGHNLLLLPKVHPDPEDMDRTADVLRERRPHWLVLDGYHFGPDYQREMRETGPRLLVMDDMAHWPSYHADVIVNQNLGAEKGAYACGEGTRLLLGPRYALLREEFLRWRDWKRSIPRLGRKVLVTLGAGDPDNQTAKVLRALARLASDGLPPTETFGGLDDLETVAVIGPLNPRGEALHAVGEGSRLNVSFQRSPEDLSPWMAWADVAVSGGGSTCWELAFMGLPNLVLVLAENQRAVAHHLEAAGVSRSLGLSSQVSEERLAAEIESLFEGEDARRRMSEKGRDLVDGGGAARICRELMDTAA